MRTKEKRKKTLRSLVFLFVILVLLFFVNGQRGCEPNPQSECLKDIDCVKTQVTCCPCNAGGQEQCIPMALASIYIEKLKNCPPADQLICTQQYNCNINNCSCDNGKCMPNPR